MEVCIDSVESAINAEKGGAIRVELCANLMEGGTTPSIGMLKTVKKRVSIPVYVMIRPRGGDFLYSPLELDVMYQDICDLKSAGADGFVFGILKEDGTVDMENCQRFIATYNSIAMTPGQKEMESVQYYYIARPLPVTFHRAIDMTKDIYEALESIISLGFERVLTSGGDTSVLEGLPVISEMVKQANGRIIIMPGGGITERNLGRILDQSGATEFHGSARSTHNSGMVFRKTHISMGASLSPPEYSVKVTDSDKVKRFLSIAGEVL